MRNRIIYLLFSVCICCLFFQACESEEQITYKRYYVNGKGLYEKYCQNCHNQDGTGLVDLYPPLTGTLYLKQNKTRLSCIIKYGLNGKIKLTEKEYEGEMPANSDLSDIDVAQLIVYITNSFGNKQGFYDATAANKDLRNCKN